MPCFKIFICLKSYIASLVTLSQQRASSKPLGQKSKAHKDADPGASRSSGNQKAGTARDGGQPSASLKSGVYAHLWKYLLLFMLSDKYFLILKKYC